MTSASCILAIAIVTLSLPGALAGRFLKGEHARILQSAASADDRRVALEELLHKEAKAIEDAYNALVHKGEEVDMCYVTSVCAPRDEFTLSFVDMYQPKNCKDTAGNPGSPWTDLTEMTCPGNAATTREAYKVDLANPSAIYPIKQGQENDVNWRNTALQTPPSQDRLKKVMCATKSLDRQWKAQYDAVPNTFWQYYGDQSTGIWKFYPGGGDTCSEYDPRMRPWYSSAATGPKDVVIVIDTSGSMGRLGRLEAAQNAADAVIDTLNAADFATVIAFDTDTRSFSDAKGNHLIRADEEARKAMKLWVHDLQDGGATNYEEAFRKAFGILGNSRREGKTTGCYTNTILFLTDGEITSGKNGDAFLSSVHSLNAGAERDTRIFTYAFGDSVVNNKEAARVLQELADQNKGVAFRVGDGAGESLKTTMAKYYVYWASGIASTQPRWSEIYTDFGTGLDCLTGALPVYDRTKEPPELFGVVGIDVAPNDDGFANHADYAATIATMREETRRCAQVHFTDQQIATLRKSLSPAVYGRVGGPAAGAAEAASVEADEEGDGGAGAVIGAAAGAVAFVVIAVWLYFSRKGGHHQGAATSDHAQPSRALEMAARPVARENSGNMYYPTAIPMGGVGHGSHRGRRAPMAVPTAPPAPPPPSGGGTRRAPRNDVAYL